MRCRARLAWASTAQLSYNAGVNPSATAEGTVSVQGFLWRQATAEGPGAVPPPQWCAA